MHSNFEIIQKAVSDEAAVLEKISKPKIKPTSKSYRDGFDDVRKNTKLKDLEGALESQKTKDVVAVIDWNDFSADVADEKLELSVEQSGKQYSQFVEPIEESNFKFEAGTAALIAFLLLMRKDRSKLVRKSGRHGTSIATNEIFDLGMSAKQGAKIIRSSIGMNAVQMQAYFNLRKNLVKADMKPAMIRDALKKYQDKSILRRSITIAQTELTDAINESHIQMFNQAAKEGIVIKGDWEEVWDSTLDGKTSRICTDLDQQAIPVGGLFVDPKGLVGPFKRPAAHPHCRSAVSFRRRKK